MKRGLTNLMRFFFMTLALLVAFLFLQATPVRAQTAGGNTAGTAKKVETPKPAPGRSEPVLDEWNDVGRKLIAMAEDFPEDKYDFKPNPEQRTVAEQLLHVVGTSYIFTDTAQGKEPRPHDLKRADYKSKADIVSALKQAVEDGAAVIKAKGDKGMDETVRLSFGNQMVRVSDPAYSMTVHASEHYGQLVVYYRVNGMVPPESRP
jgi:uncharacterized damage-inducible protein DinB